MQRDFLSFTQFGLPVLAFLAGADIASGVLEDVAGIQVDRQQDPVRIFIFQNLFQVSGFAVPLFDGIKPGQGEVTVHIQTVSVFDYLGVVNVNPCGHPVLVKHLCQFGQQGFIRLVQQVGNGLSQDGNTGKDDDSSEKKGQ